MTVKLAKHHLTSLRALMKFTLIRDSTENFCRSIIVELQKVGRFLVVWLMEKFVRMLLYRCDCPEYEWFYLFARDY